MTVSRKSKQANQSDWIGADLPPLHTPEAVGKRFGRSGWWVREQCRRGRFPHTRAAGAIRFTNEQFAEILRILERRPSEAPQQQGSAVGRRAQPKALEASVVQLQARPPRRTRNAPSGEGVRTA